MTHDLCKFVLRRLDLDLEEAELCYAPLFGSPRDPVHFAGMVPADVLWGDKPLYHWDSLDGEFLLDVRNPPELAVDTIPSAVNIPLPQLRARLGKLPRGREFSSCAAPPGVPITRRTSCCRTGSKPEISP
jgi:hypothetical protein